jgi:hypothetical protein
MLYEGLKEKGAMIVVPSTAVETMGLGAITGLASIGAAQKITGPVPGVNAPADTGPGAAGTPQSTGGS